MANYTLEQLTPEKFEVLIPLMQNCFGMNVDIDYFKWKFIDNPAGFVMGHYAVSEDGQAVAYNGLIPEWYWVDGKKVKIYQTCDVMTHSGHRRQGLFEKVMRKGDETLAGQSELFTFGFASDSSMPGSCKTGRIFLFNVWYHFKPSFQSRIENILSPLKKAKALYQVEIIDKANLYKIIDIIQKNVDPARISHVRDMDYMKWKLENPRHKYIITAVKKENEYIGYAIHYIKSQKLMLFDYYGSTTFIDRLLMNVLNSEAINLKLDGMVTYAQEKTSFSRRILRNGFWINKTKYGPMRERIYFLLHASNRLEKEFGKSEFWSITPVDNDAF